MNRETAAVIVRREMEPVRECLQDMRDRADIQFASDLQQFRDQRDHGILAPCLDSIPQQTNYRRQAFRTAFQEEVTPFVANMKREPQVQKALDVLGRRRERKSHPGGFSQDTYDIAQGMNSIKKIYYLGTRYLNTNISGIDREGGRDRQILENRGLIIKSGKKYTLTERGRVAAIVAGELLEFCEVYGVSLQRLLGRSENSRAESEDTIAGISVNLNIFKALLDNYPRVLSLADIEKRGIDTSAASMRCIEFSANGFINYITLTHNARTKTYRPNEGLPESIEGLFSDIQRGRSMLEIIYPFIVQSKGDFTKQEVIDWLVTTYPNYKTYSSLYSYITQCISILRDKNIIVATKDNSTAIAGLSEGQYQMLSDFIDIFSGIDQYMTRGILEEDETPLHDTVGNQRIWNQIARREAQSGIGFTVRQGNDVIAAITLGIEAHPRGVEVSELYKFLIQEFKLDMSLAGFTQKIKFHERGVIENGVVYPKGTVTPGPLKRD